MGSGPLHADHGVETWQPDKTPIFTEDDEEKEKHLLRKEAGLVRSGRLFGGLIDDFNRKKPWFLKDFTDALSMKTVASVIFIYFATLAPTVAFGGLLGDATDNRMASIECLVAGLIAGVLFGMFSGQPLTILGVTGPDLVFESIVFDFCKTVSPRIVGRPIYSNCLAIHNYCDHP